MTRAAFFARYAVAGSKRTPSSSSVLQMTWHDRRSSLGSIVSSKRSGMRITLCTRSCAPAAVIFRAVQSNAEALSTKIWACRSMAILQSRSCLMPGGKTVEAAKSISAKAGSQVPISCKGPGYFGEARGDEFSEVSRG